MVVRWHGQVCADIEKVVLNLPQPASLTLRQLLQSQPPLRGPTATRAAPPTPVRSHPGQQPAPRSRRELARLASPGPGNDPRRARRSERLRSPAFLRRETGRVLTAAGRFLRAFYADDAGNRDSDVTDALKAFSTATLAGRLLGAPKPRLPPTMERPPPPATVVAMSPEFDQPPVAALVRVRSLREGRENVGGVVLVLRGEHWRASRLTD